MRAAIVSKCFSFPARSETTAIILATFCHRLLAAERIMASQLSSIAQPSIGGITSACAAPASPCGAAPRQSLPSLRLGCRERRDSKNRPASRRNRIEQSPRCRGAHGYRLGRADRTPCLAIRWGQSTRRDQSLQGPSRTHLKLGEKSRGFSSHLLSSNSINLPSR
jgi:hypothetical protein